MRRLVQCVPNFSEGRRPEVVRAIADAIGAAAKVRVVDYSMDPDHNRAVVTFIGTPEDVRTAMLTGARTAVQHIDLNSHEGGHPRIGAVDVVPVVPLTDVTMEECIDLGHAIGSDIAAELRIPVYFYEQCALRNHCRNLADVRKGGYEGLKKSGLVGDRAPDVGPAQLHPTAGACVVGARGPLIAYNVNLATADVAPARRIAARIRELRDSGQGMAGVKAIAVYLRSRNIAQVSTNITQPHLTGLYEVFSFIEREAREMGIEVLESELIGGLRTQALVDLAARTLKLPGLSIERVLDNWFD